ncbi:MAG: cysteine desulfurase-like protein [Woeseia sp.]|nr:cysteine desulfurase-like protein [Woeseia sp.]MBT8095857.1 cysteine desulfurase-like protein [Woeseia sp.]NNE61866.1 cysteine desulfurase-like protein [Woeseia sp.]NNL55111.1 cysteine desulfurase-like protein [Woeseia sp.]
MGFELDVIRAQFPALAIKDSGRPRIYLDNPAGTQVPQIVVDRMTECLIEANANLGGYFATSRLAEAIVDEAHQAAADFLNAASPEEIIFGQNMTTLTLHVSRSIGRTLQGGDEIILSRMDHDANVMPWVLLAKDLGLVVRWLPFNPETFEFDLAELDNLLNAKTKLVCIGGASNLLGTVNDIKSISARARSAGALTYIDAVQLAPHVPIDVQDIGCDFLACSAYKFFGPHQGVLWGKRAVLESLPPYNVRPALKNLPNIFETGTQSHEGMAGTAAAIDYFAWVGQTMAQDHFDDNVRFKGRSRLVHAALDCLFQYEKELALHLIAGLQQLPGVRVLGVTDRSAMDRRVPTVSFTADGKASPAIARGLAERNIFVWSGDNYAVEAAEVLGIAKTGGAVRIGPVHYNSVDELDILLNTLDEVLAKADAA